MNWTRSTKCEQGACVEVAWEASTKCDTNACVEVSGHNHPEVGVIVVRNNQRPSDMVQFDHDEWKAFIAGVKEGEFDL